MDERILLGKRIKELRRLRDFSQEQLAEKMAINPKYLSSIERGHENPTFDLILRLARALRVETAALFNYSCLRLPEAELRKRLRAMADGADVNRVREILALLNVPES